MKDRSKETGKKKSWLTILIAAALSLFVVASSCSSNKPTPKATPQVSGPLQPESKAGIAGWKLVSHDTVTSFSDGEGLATVTLPTGKQTTLYRGSGSVSATLKFQGWSHVGDPASYNGYIFDDYQATSPKKDEKMYLVTTPRGQTFQYIHKLLPGELYNNSFVAVAPGGKWMISGTWTQQKTFQIYPTPLLNSSTPSDGGSLSLSGSIKLDHPVYWVQGCDFVSPTSLLCSSTGSKSDFTNTKPLFSVTLSGPLSSKTVVGTVHDLGSIPEQSSCAGTFEAEGVDYNQRTGIFRVEVIQPGDCIIHTTVYSYERSPVSS